MSEQFKGERGPKIQKYTVLQEAMNKEDRIMKEIDNVLTTTSDREEAEKIVLERYAPQMDEAMKKSRQALDEWLEAIRS